MDFEHYREFITEDLIAQVRRCMEHNEETPLVWIAHITSVLLELP